MTTTKSFAKHAWATQAMAAKPRFGPEALKALLDEINLAPELLEYDWRALVSAAFGLDGDQAQSLTRVTPERIEEIQAFFHDAARHIRRGGALQGRIYKRPPEARTLQAVHEIHLELVPAADMPDETSTPIRMLSVAHCDADCRNWEWNSIQE